MKTDYMQLAIELAARSGCLRRKVGAVLVSADGERRISSVNDPRPYREICMERGCLRDQFHIRSGRKLSVCRCCHCERDLLNRCREDGIPTAGAVLYTTLFPCEKCARALVKAGIREIVYLSRYNENRSMGLLRKAHIEVRQYTLTVEEK